MMVINRIYILFIGNDEEEYLRIRDMIEESSLSTKYRLDWVSTHEAALEAMAKNRHDAILLDSGIGARNALDFLHEMDVSRCRGPIILLTAQEEGHADPAALKAGVADVLAKGALIPLLLERSLYYAIATKKMQEQLRASEERFHQFAENIDMVFWITSLKGDRMIYVNQTYETVWRRSREVLLARPKSWLDAVHPEDRDRVVDASDFAGPECCGLQEYRIVTPDNSVRWIRDRSFPVRNEAGEVYRVARISEDITDEKKRRQEAEYRRQQILHAEKLASLGEVVAGVAHEINNPNSFISTNLPLLQETWQAVEPILFEYAAAHPEWREGPLSLDELCRDMREIIEAIKIGSDRINQVVVNLKDFVRTDESAHTRPVQVNDVVEKTYTIVGAQLRKSASQVDVNLAEGLPLVDGHLYKLEQVVANLLLNAAHAIADKTEGKIGITTRYVERLRSVLIEVEDNGLGMDHDVQDRLFEPFFTTRRASGGTGLGLSVSYGLVREHGGTIGILSRPGLGSRFTVYLPIDRAAPLQLSPMVLCVDDDLAFLNMLKTIFFKVNADVGTLNDAEGVLTYLEDHPEVDIVLSDLVMPGMNGWELLRRVKARFPLLPFILYSGNRKALDERPTGIPQPDCFLGKPFTVRELRQIIDGIGRQRL